MYFFLLWYNQWELDFYDSPLCSPEKRIYFPSVSIRGEAINHEPIIPINKSHINCIPLHLILHVKTFLKSHLLISLYSVEIFVIVSYFGVQFFVTVPV